MIEQAILSSLMRDDRYCDKVIHHLKPEYFSERGERSMFQILQDYHTRFGSAPSPEALRIELSLTHGRDLSEAVYRAAQEAVAKAAIPVEHDFEWLVQATEKFCRNRAIYLALMRSIEIHESGKEPIESIPSILQEALSVSFDTDIGHDYVADAEQRWEYYHRPQSRIPFHIDLLNRVTGGGLPRKTLNVLLAGTNVGKTMTMCDMAANHLLMGYNVLYVTLEMSEEEISKRIDANLLDTPMDEVMQLDREVYVSRVESMRSRVGGKLIVKEYPTAAASSAHFRALLNELAAKKGFTPDVLYVDYLNICASARIRMGQGVNSYSYVKAIAEELRGLAVEFNVAVVTGSQFNRTGFASDAPGLTDTAESFGVPMTADWIVALVTNEELDKVNQLLVIQLKSRYGDITRMRNGVVGVDRAKMRLRNVVAEVVPNALARSAQANAVASAASRFAGLVVEE